MTCSVLCPDARGKSQGIRSCSIAVRELLSRLGLSPGALLPFLQGARPVIFEQARQGTVCKDLARRLAAGAVVGLVLRINDALHRGAAIRARLAKPAVHGHAGAESSHFLREAIASFLPQ